MRLPNDTERHCIVGRTGSGKTQLAAWMLSERSYDVMPWVIINSKGDKLLNQIGAEEISIYKEPPTKPGLYMVRPMPHEEKALEQFLWKIWARGHTGLYIDEGYLIGNRNAAFRALLTQGRSKYIPIIICSQRPVYMDRFVWSECEWFSILHLSNARDRDTIECDVLHGSPLQWERLQNVHKYHSIYYSVNDDKMLMLKPVPSQADILKTFRDRMPEQGERFV